MVDTAIIVALGEMNQVVFFNTFSILDFDAVAIGADNFAISFSNNQLAGIASNIGLDTSADRWRLRLQQRHRLALHIRTSQGAVDAVFLDEWHQASSRAEDLLVRSVNQRHFRSIDAGRLQELAGRNTRTFQIIILVELDASVGNHFVNFLGSIEINNFIGDMAANNLKIWRLDEAIFVNSRISR